MTVLSMTGFGQAQLLQNALSLTVEVRSVNSRYIDINAKLPFVYSQYEPEINKIIKSKIRRGRIDLFINRKEESESLNQFILNEDIFTSYLQGYKKAIKIAGLNEFVALPQILADLLSKKDVFSQQIVGKKVENELQLLSDVVNVALDNLILQRRVEGEALLKELLKLIEELRQLSLQIANSFQNNVESYSAKLLARIEKVAKDLNLDENRLAQEVAIYADKIDITEELTRLNAHLDLFISVISSESEVGKKLEFLTQEIGRELNTITSKSQNSHIAKLIIDSKSILEKIREQVLNLE